MIFIAAAGHLVLFMHLEQSAKSALLSIQAKFEFVPESVPNRPIPSPLANTPKGDVDRG